MTKKASTEKMQCLARLNDQLLKAKEKNDQNLIKQITKVIKRVEHNG